MRQAGEPSVEEILESIKKVIARDNRVSADEERKDRIERGLVQVAADQTPDARRAAGPDDEDEILDLSEDAALNDDDDVPADNAPLLTEHAALSMRESLAALAMLAQPGMQPQIVRSGETSLEGLARELLRPALTAWLDKNLPAIVERLVAAEIARIVGKKG